MCDGNGQSTATYSLAIGFPWSQAAFVKEARALTHPFDERPRVPARVARAISNIAQLGPDGVRSKRLRVLDELRFRSESLAEEGEKLHAALHPDVRTTVAGKRVLFQRTSQEDKV